jgi:hypothetical protein
MRVTFPQWSPPGKATDPEKLSVWFTFSPAYQAWLPRLLGTALRPGDPAAVLDAATGKVGWMAVNAYEKAQVGHYYLLKKEYAEAWHWYEQAERELEPEQTRPAADLTRYLRGLGSPRDFSFFEFYCLRKLGRADEAAARLEKFLRTFLTESPDGQQDPLLGVVVDGVSGRQLLQDLADPARLSGCLLRDLYMAEVFLSVDAAADGEAFFRAGLAAADTDPVRLSKAVVLGQLLLLQKKYPDYAELATDVIAPLALKLHVPEPKDGKPVDLRTNLQELALVCAALPGLAPLSAPEFHALLPEEEDRSLFTRWGALRGRAADAPSRQAVDHVLYASAKRLGLEKEQKEIAARITVDGGAVDADWRVEVSRILADIRIGLGRRSPGP